MDKWHPVAGKFVKGDKTLTISQAFDLQNTDTELAAACFGLVLKYRPEIENDIKCITTALKKEKTFNKKWYGRKNANS